MSNRRDFLVGAAAVAGAMSLPSVSLARARKLPRSPHGKVLAGVFPIAWTPCRPDGKLDQQAMAAQRAFLNRGKVAGVAWPQNASGWETLSPQEWHEGADALLSVQGGGAVVLGVQTVGFNIKRSAEYARYAGSKGADAIISLTPPGASDADIISYFKTLASASNLPLLVQAVGDVSVESLIRLCAAVPTVVAVKDEAGDPLQRAPLLQAGTHGRLENFSGSGGYTFFAELEEGFEGTCPYVGMADVLQRCFDLYQHGRKREAFDVFGRFLAFNSIPRSNDYVLVARGVFPEEDVMRANPRTPGMIKSMHHPPSGPITAAQKAEIRRALDEYLKPYLVA
ncbi:MAG: dihydrodipicolinate synthase family protein [Steroidobacteraceae bacterium]